MAIETNVVNSHLGSPFRTVKIDIFYLNAGKCGAGTPIVKQKRYPTPIRARSNHQVWVVLLSTHCILWYTPTIPQPRAQPHLLAFFREPVATFDCQFSP